jgi:hypothetical protein
MSALTEDGLRQRIPYQSEEQQQKASSTQAPESDDMKRSHVVWGQTPSGQGAHRCSDSRPLCSLTRVSATIRVSIPRPDDARRHHGALPPFLPKIAHRHP